MGKWCNKTYFGAFDNVGPYEPFKAHPIVFAKSGTMQNFHLLKYRTLATFPRAQKQKFDFIPTIATLRLQISIN